MKLLISSPPHRLGARWFWWAFTMFVALCVNAVPAAVQAQEHWTLLADGIGARVDIDTTSAIRGAHTVTVWLRYHFYPNQQKYDFERTQVDCRNRRSRVLEKRRPRPPTLLASEGVQMEEQATDSAWAFQSGENLGTEVIKAVCRFTQTS
jgi:hypothetical protein